MFKKTNLALEGGDPQPDGGDPHPGGAPDGERQVPEMKQPGDDAYRAPGDISLADDPATDGLGVRDAMFAIRQWYLDNHGEEAYGEFKEWVSKNLWTIIQQEFPKCDTNANQVIDESEWVNFVQQIRNEAVQQGQKWPLLDDIMVRRYYYAVNMVYNEHAGVSLPKLKKAVELFEEHDANYLRLQEEQIQMAEYYKKKVMNCCGAYLLCCCIVLLILVFSGCNSYAVRSGLDQMPGKISDDLSRKKITPRPDFRAQLQKRKIFYYDDPALQWSPCEYDTYWNEEGMAVISNEAEKRLLEATYELHSMALEAVDLVVNDETLLDLFYIHKDLWPAIKKGWKNGRTDFQGRFDFAWDGKKSIKLLEYNADTPSLQLESGLLSADWFRQKKFSVEFERPSKEKPWLLHDHQSNYLDKYIREFALTIKEQCKSQRVERNLHTMMNEGGYRYELIQLALLTVPSDDENTGVMQYFLETFQRILGKDNVVLQSINEVDFRYMPYIETKTKQRIYQNKLYGSQRFFDCSFSLYPKEWMVSEQSAYPMKEYDWADLKSFEPFWKLILGNKALLPLLWSMYPGHPLLLPAYYDNPREQLGQRYKKMSQEWVSKPVFGREGMGVFFSKNYSGNFDEFVRASEKNFGSSGDSSNKLGQSIYQAETDLPAAQGRIIQTSSWVIQGKPAGLIFREGKQGHHFEDSNPFLLHSVLGQKLELDFKDNVQTYLIRKKIYGSRFREEHSSNTYQVKNGFLIGKTNKESHKNWISYKRRDALVKDYVAQEEAIKLNEADVTYIRSMYLKRSHYSLFTIKEPENPNYSRFIEYHHWNSGVSYQLQHKRFGTTAAADLSGRGQWFSVDQHGKVRRHSYYSSGFGRS